MLNNDWSLSPWLDELPYDWSELEELGAVISIKKDENLFLYNDPVEYIYIVREGRIRLSLNSVSGDEKTIAIIGKNGLLGESDFFQNQRHVATAIASSPSIVIKVKPMDFQNVIFKNKIYMNQLLQMMSLKIRLLTQDSLYLAHSSSYQRICLMFLQLGMSYGDDPKNPSQINITIPFTQQEVADLVGATRVTVANNIKLLISKNIISKSGKYYCIENVAKLNEELYSIQT
ncbi:Crp/Fnr family transcriptional regulator [Ornithinibacillus sp. 4-3]|uniref:Crp/Fnr family transcriptional regulator n=1 Tax=Ornithinibacillus sp. 4-3 TaxID=3231488 RepID=A0AB39HQW6_9BACI